MRPGGQRADNNTEVQLTVARSLVRLPLTGWGRSTVRTRTLLGGAVIFVALLVHIGLEFQRMSRPQRAGVTGLPSPN